MKESKKSASFYETAKNCQSTDAEMPSVHLDDDGRKARPCTEQITINPKQQRRQRFVAVFEQLKNDLIHYLEHENMPFEAVEWYRRNLDHNVPGGKLIRGLGVVHAVQIMRNRALTEDEFFKAAVLGWCIELMQASLLVADDIMDKSITRRGRPCWYQVRGVGAIAINDAFMLEGAIYRVLRQHFSHEPYYTHVLEDFHDTTFRTLMGQMLDVITASGDHIDLTTFSFQKHALITQYKTAYHSIYLTAALAMRICGVPESYEVNGLTVQPYDVTLSLALPIGEYAQTQDDFLDFAGTPEQTGKIGTDIVDSKCSWCINVALAVATPAQRAVLDANYGRRDPMAEQRVKEVYEAIGLRDRYRLYEDTTKARIEEMIKAIPESEEDVQNVLRREVFTAFMSMLYQRSK